MKFVVKLISFLWEVRAEMKKVNWLQRNEVIAYTTAVVAISLAVAVYLGVLDYILQKILNIFVL